MDSNLWIWLALLHFGSF